MNRYPSQELKVPMTFEEQLSILKSRGLIVDDDDLAIRTLQRINYYRLSAYGLSLKQDDIYHSGTTFEHILALYEFDRRFRYIMLELVEQVEIAFRTHISYYIAHTYGALGYLEQENLNNHEVFLAEVEKEMTRSQEIFIKHHNEKYKGRVPIWVVVEVLSFGALSKLFSNMKSTDKNHIARQYYRAPAIYLESWLKCMSYIRNICAHYGRLYNRPLTSKPRFDRKAKQLNIKQNKIFAYLYVLKELTPDRIKWTSFVTRLEALLTEYKDVVELHRIGFPEDWESILMTRQ